MAEANEVELEVTVRRTEHPWQRAIAGRDDRNTQEILEREMSTIAHGDAVSDGYRYRWMVYRDSRRIYYATVDAHVKEQRINISVGKELMARPASKDEARKLCDDLVPALIKLLKSMEEHGTDLSALHARQPSGDS